MKEIDVQSCVSLMWKWLGNSNWRHAKLRGKCILSKPTNHPTHHYKLLQTLKANHLSAFFIFVKIVKMKFQRAADPIIYCESQGPDLKTFQEHL